MSTTENINAQIEILAAPRIPGLVFRGFRGPADYPEILKVIDASKVADQIDRSDTLEDIARNYAHLTNCDPYQDMVFAEIKGEVVGYCRVTWKQEPASGNRNYFSIGFLKPDWRRKGIGRAMLNFAQHRLRQIAETHPRDGQRFFEAWVRETEQGTAAMLLRDGYQPVRHAYEMVRPDLENIEPAVLPPGLIVRPAEGPLDFRQVWDASQEAFQDHWGYVPDSDEEYQSWLEDRLFQPDLWRVAWDGDQVAGMVLSYIDEEQNREFNRRWGWTENICVRRPYRRQGLAKALILMSLEAIRERGMTQAALGVDTENTSGALRLYESVGFRPISRSSTYRKPME